MVSVACSKPKWMVNCKLHKNEREKRNKYILHIAYNQVLLSLNLVFIFKEL